LDYATLVAKEPAPWQLRTYMFSRLGGSDTVPGSTQWVLVSTSAWYSRGHRLESRLVHRLSSLRVCMTEFSRFVRQTAPHRAGSLPHSPTERL